MPYLDPNYLTLMVFLKVFLEQVDIEKVCKNYRAMSMQRVISHELTMTHKFPNESAIKMAAYVIGS